MLGQKTGGRTKGTPNKQTIVTSQLKEKIFNLLENQFEELESEFNNLSSKEKFEVYIKLLPYVIPKQLETTNYNETDLNVEVDRDKLIELKHIILKMEN